MGTRMVGRNIDIMKRCISGVQVRLGSQDV